MSKKSDLKYHGGQNWSELTVFHEDFSVTTNGLGTPASGIQAAKASLDLINHYPLYSQEPAFSNFAHFIWNSSINAEINKKRLILGNGSSDLIDCTIRYLNRTGVKSFRPGPTLTQYKDYQRIADSTDMSIKKFSDNSAQLLCLVNPTNPTGDFMKIDEMKSYIETKCARNSHIIVDESMLFWFGPDWREQSLTNESDWIRLMYSRSNISVFIVHSWTKIWSCCGVRIGSIIAPTIQIANALRKRQTSWNVNTVALSFANAALKDEEYMRQTWKWTSQWRKQFINGLLEIFPTWKVSGEEFLSWVWVDTGDKMIAERAFEMCENHGVPIRWAKYGYNLSTHIRFAVRKPEKQQFVFGALRALKQELH